MLRVKPPHLARLVLYGGLGLTLLLALRPPLALSRQDQGKESAEATPSEIRSMQEAVLQTYLTSLPTPLQDPVITQIHTTTDAHLSMLMDWLPTPPLHRPAALLDSPLPQGTALHEALLTASLVGRDAPTLTESTDLLPRLDLDPDAPIRLKLFQALAQRAESEGDISAALNHLASAARHPSATWNEVQKLVELALNTRQTAAAISLLEDWQQTPPYSTTPDQTTSVCRQLAHLFLTSNQPVKAWASLAPLLTDPNQTLPAETLDLAWTVANLTGNDRAVVPHLETNLRQHPHHGLHWRELSDAPSPTETYLTHLSRFASACLAAAIDSRACETLFHLAWLDHDHRIDHLTQALPIAHRLDRLPELFDLITLLVDADSDRDPTLVLKLATTCFHRGDLTGAERLLVWQLGRTPDHLTTTRLLLQVKTHTLPAMQAAQLWRRHLQQHPTDTPAHHEFVEVWLAADQPRAAINHLLATNSAHLDPALRLRTAALALQTRHQTALQTALQRLATANEPPSPDLHPELARVYHEVIHSPKPSTE